MTKEILSTKRLFDVCMALSGLVVITPLLGLVAASIRLVSPGPALFCQTRVGRGGRRFDLYKFRTMVVGAEKLGSTITFGRDPRITPLGRILRRTKIDEIPQLWNVVRGDMSLVGPRPEVPEVVAMYTSKMRRVLSVKPGITSGASLQLYHEEHLLDLTVNPDDAYLRIFVPLKVARAMQEAVCPSLFHNMLILLATVWGLTLGRLFVQQENELDSFIRHAVEKYNRDRPDLRGEELLDSWRELPDPIKREIF